jgi:hypothetical protein
MTLEASAFSDRLRQPDNLPKLLTGATLRLRKIHGFASLPRDRFAFIVCNRQTPKDRFRRWPATTIEIKHGPAMFVNSSFFQRRTRPLRLLARVLKLSFEPSLGALVEHGIEVKGQ